MRVFLTRPLPDPSPELLAGHEVRIHPGPYPIPREDLLEGAGWADALVTLLSDPVDEAVMTAGSRPLAVVGNYAVGVDNIDLEVAARLGIPVVNTPGVLTEATADLTWALILSLTRRIVEGDRLTRAGEYPGWAPDFHLGWGLQGKVLGIYGMGRIGRAVARRGRVFGMEIRYHNRRPLSETDLDGLEATWVDLDELTATSDVLSLHAPLSPENHHVFGRERLGRMKPGSFLVNTARGPLVDEAALVEVLESGPLAGAGLDVFEFEPALVPGLAERPEVVLAPHVGSATVEARAAMAALVSSGVAAVLRGERPANLVEPELEEAELKQDPPEC